MSDTNSSSVEVIVEVPYEEYQQMKQDQQWLQALEAAGVDNWEGISYAHELLEEK